MPITLGSNIASLRAQRQLSGADSRLSTVFERLSSGQRINRASDDAAGLAISDSLGADRRVFTQGIRNFNDGLSLLNIADSTVSELSNIVIRIQELAEQSANGPLSHVQRASLDEEAQALRKEFFRVSRTSEFNDLNLFDGTLSSGISLQGGYGTDGLIQSSLGGVMGDGTFEPPTSFSTTNNTYAIETGDFNGDGIIDLATVQSLANSVSIHIGNGDGTFAAANSVVVSATINTLSVADFNNDGILDLATNVNNLTDNAYVFTGNGNGTFTHTATISSIPVVTDGVDVADLDGDGDIDLVFQDSVALYVALNSGDGTFTASGISNPTTAYSFDIQTGDVNGDGMADVVISSYNDYAAEVLISVGDGTFQSAGSYAVPGGAQEIKLGDLNDDGNLDMVIAHNSQNGVSVLLGNGDGSFQGNQFYSTGDIQNSIDIADFNGDGFLDVFTSSSATPGGSILLGAGDGTLELSSTIPSIGTGNFRATTGDFNSDGVVDLAVGRTSGVNVLLGSTREGIAPLLDFSLKTQADAMQALAPLSDKLQSLAEQRGVIGAYQARLGSAINTLQVSSENYAAAQSRIRDSDIAFESANLTRLQILQQSAAAVLSQANQQPALALRLLQT